MIKAETVDLNGRTFMRTYSDENKIIRKVGTDEIYSEAVDILPCIYEYTETDQPIEATEGEN